MKTVFLSIFFILISSFAFSQEPERYARARVDLNGKSMKQLAELGIEVDHGQWISKTSLISDFSESEIDLIENAGFQVRILIADVNRFYAGQNLEGEQKSDPDSGCIDDGMEFPTPQNFELGSMGGYFTYQEMLDELDEMVAAYPDLITAKQPIAGGLSIEGRPLYWVRLSDNPGTDEPEPEILYTALHHAREPAGLSQMIYYLWYLLENYNSDDFVTFLVNNTELYFMPCVNPDGYIYNETNFPGGGGLWRKNRRVNDDGSEGVDLNRNYGYNWGLDDTGSSPFPGSNVYRGTAPFSEPETQLVRDFVSSRQFELVLNYHTYGNYLIYPWAFSVELTPDSTIFSEFSDIMTRENNYTTGTAFETVGYFVNGDSDDWMYAEHDALAMTPEAGPGNFGFWPPLTEIDNICKASMWQNLSTAALVHNFGEMTDLSPSVIGDLSGEIDFSIKRYGMASAPLEASLVAVSPNIVTVSPPLSFSLNQFQTETSSFLFALEANIAQGEEVVFDLVINNGNFSITKRITKLYGTLSELISDDFQGLDSWTNGFGNASWAITSDEYYSAPSSITDSPVGDYPPNVIKTIELTNPLNLVDAVNASLTFRAKWEIEPGWDYVQVQASGDGLLFTPLCGNYTKPGAVPQDPGQPVIDGTQQDWILEEMSLDDFLGDQLYIRFLLVSDGGVEKDGFYFDDLKVNVISELSTSVIPIEVQDLSHRILPNPSGGFFSLELTGVDPNDSGLFELYSTTAKKLIEEVISQGQNRVVVKADHLPSGIYPYSVKFASGRIIRGKAILFPGTK